MGNSRKGYRISIGKYSNVKCRGEWMQRNIDSTPFSFRLQPFYLLPSSEKVPTHTQGDISADLESIMKTKTPVPTTNQTLTIKPAGSYFTDCIVTPQYCLFACKNSQFFFQTASQPPGYQVWKWELCHQHNSMPSVCITKENQISSLPLY